MVSPNKGKAKVQVTSSGKRVSYGQKGASVKPGTPKGDSYCAKQNDPNTPNNLSRKRWKCSGAKSKR